MREWRSVAAQYESCGRDLVQFVSWPLVEADLLDEEVARVRLLRVVAGGDVGVEDPSRPPLTAAQPITLAAQFALRVSLKQ